MIRKLSLAAILSAGVALPAIAQQTETIDPSKKGPTDSMSQQVPAMKETDAKPALPSTAATPSTAPAAMPAGAASGTSMAIILPEADAKNWVGKPVYSSDNQKIGDVESFRRGTDGNVVGLNAGIGGFLGLGETRVMLSSSQFKLAGDRVTTSVLAAEAKALPKVVQ